MRNLENYIGVCKSPVSCKVMGMKRLMRFLLRANKLF
ncbi:unnamed protein product [Ixodes pacificus]